MIIKRENRKESNDASRMLKCSDTYSLFVVCTLHSREYSA